MRKEYRIKWLTVLFFLLAFQSSSSAQTGPTPTPSPTPPIPGDVTFELSGFVYDLQQGPSAGIEGATVEVSNYGFGQGGSDQTISGPDGYYFVSMPGHDTNYVTVEVQAEGYYDFSEEIGSVMEYMWGTYDVGMSPKMSAEYDRCDLNKDGSVDARDLFILQKQWHTGSSVTPTPPPSSALSVTPIPALQ